MILKDIAKIVEDYMGLANGKVWIKDEKLNLPTDNSFTITIGFMSLKGIGSTTRNILVTPPVGDAYMTEETATNMFAQVSIDILGRSFDVVTRAPEIIMAMDSNACKETQMLKGFLIGKLPTSMNDISGIDGSAIPYRFQITFNVQFLVKKTKSNVDYYDNFSKEIIYE